MQRNNHPHSRSISVVDVTARDGLQNEKVIFSTAEKLALIGRAIDAGAKRVEVASFAHPKYVPQMADAEAVIAGLPHDSGAEFIGLVMNERGAERAFKTNIAELGLVAVASDSFAQKNQGQTRQSSVDMACAMIERARTEGRKASVTIATSFGCPFEGEIDPQAVLDMVAQLAPLAPRDISLADTIGVANPWQVTDLFTRARDVIAKTSPRQSVPLRAHFHNTRNTGLANVHAAMGAGVGIIDVSIGGLGGCPFALNATGNVPAEDVIYMLERAGFNTGWSLDKVIETAQWLSQKMDRDLPAMVSKAGGFPVPSVSA